MLKQRIILFPNVSLNLVWCPAGSAFLGEEGTVVERKLCYQKHRVEFKEGFWMSEIPISTAIGGELWDKKLYDPLDFPLIGIVTWNAANRFCKLLTKKALEIGQIVEGEKFMLPTEYQWEYACRAGTSTRWFWGDDSEEVENYAWHQTNSGDEMHASKLKKPNPWGLYDMYGNVPEWCLEYVKTDLSISSADSSRAIVRGGWFYENLILDNDFPFRRLMSKDNPMSEEIGFRVVLNKVES